MLKIYTDGAARGNPGPAAIGYVIFKVDRLIGKKTEYIGKSTNNIAEYKAIISALSSKPKYKEITIMSDSLLVVSQINGKYKIKKEHLKKLYVKVQKLIANRKITFEWTDRETPGIVLVDSLINEELDKHV